MPRAFIAIEIDDTSQKSLLKIQDELKDHHLEASWVKTANIHLTLRFLGEISNELVGKVSESLSQITPRYPVFEFEMSQVGAFPTTQSPRVVWVGCQDENNILTRIYQDIETNLTNLGIVPDDHKFSAHLTIGRIKSRKNTEQLKGFFDKNKDIRFGTQKVNVLTLFQSTLTPAGPIYNPLGKFPFRI